MPYLHVLGSQLYTLPNPYTLLLSYGFIGLLCHRMHMMYRRAITQEQRGVGLVRE